MDITEFWIIDRAGIPLFCFSPIKDLDAELISGFFMALQTFANQLMGNAEYKNKDSYINDISMGML